MTNQSFHWQDHVIPARRTVVDLAATVLVLTVLAAAALANDRPCADGCRPAAETRSAVSEQTPSLAEITRPSAYPDDGP